MISILAGGHLRNHPASRYRLTAGCFLSSKDVSLQSWHSFARLQVRKERWKGAGGLISLPCRSGRNPCDLYLPALATKGWHRPQERRRRPDRMIFPNHSKQALEMMHLDMLFPRIGTLQSHFTPLSSRKLLTSVDALSTAMMPVQHYHRSSER